MTPPELHTADLDAPVAVVATTTKGRVVVVADDQLPCPQMQHVLDYADRLSDLPEPRRG